MTHLDLCTGIGGFHLAAEWAGFETVGFSEVDDYCCKLLAQKWPEIKNYTSRAVLRGDRANRKAVSMKAVMIIMPFDTAVALYSELTHQGAMKSDVKVDAAKCVAQAIGKPVPEKADDAG